MQSEPHALIINFDVSDEEAYTVGAFSIVRTLTDLNIDTSYFDNTEIDLNIENESHHSQVFQQAANLIRDNTIFIGFSVITSNIDVSLICARFLREKFPNITIGFGGVFIGSHSFTEKYKKALEDFDFYLNGKGDETLKELASWGFRTENFKPRKGLSFKNKEGFHHNDEKMVFETYKPISYMPKAGDSNYVETSFSVGCPYRCSFCSQHFHYPNFIRSDVDDCIKELRPHKGKMVFITDALINSNHTWLENLCNRIIDEKLEIKWYSWFRVSRRMNDTRYLSLLYESGCRVIVFGLESASSSVLKHMKKFNNEKQIYQIFDKVRDLNKQGKFLTIKLNIIAGYPTETNDDFDKTYFFLKKNSDIISDVSINPALLNLELKDFIKLKESGAVLYANNIHDWATAVSTPQIRIERLNRLRELLSACKIKHSIHNEGPLKEVLLGNNNSRIVEHDENQNPWIREFSSKQQKDKMLLFPSLEEISNFFKYEREKVTVITSTKNYFNLFFSNQNDDKFKTEQFIQNELIKKDYSVKRKPINFFIFLLLKRNMLKGKLNRLNHWLTFILPWLSFHSHYELTLIR